MARSYWCQQSVTRLSWLSVTRLEWIALDIIIVTVHYLPTSQNFPSSKIISAANL